MRIRRFSRSILSALVAVASATSVSAAVVADPAYVVGSIPLPVVNAADVAVLGASLAIGQGSFGAGGQSIIRLDPNGGVFTIV